MPTASRASRTHRPPPATAPVRAGSARLFLILFLTLAVSVTFLSRDAFFRTTTFEEGDDAANAFQISRAKELRELHGNYSRWLFHHPGPAFFYAYAAGEWLLHDVARIAPAPRNAHLYTGTLVQLAFYAAALALLARQARQPWLVVALGLAAASLHFPFIERDHLIYSVWPPDVLVMPFLCFVVAAAVVSLGQRHALPVLIVSGSFLVHGHVAQPLFVVPITLLALLLAWRRAFVPELRDTFRHMSGRVAWLLLGVFLLPLAIDLLAGRDSNALAILRHLRFQSDAGQSPWQSLLCFASYFIAVTDQAIFNNLGPASYAPFRERTTMLLVWVALLGFAIWRFRPRRATLSTGATFGARLLLFWFAATALTLVWGMRQDGGFTSFNSDFNHAIVHVVAFAAILGLDAVLPALSPAVARFAAAAGVVAFALALPYDPSIGTRGDELEVRLAPLLAADPNPAAPKLITWEVPGEDWYESITLARAFQRRGIAAYVHPSWSFMFGPERVFENIHDRLGRGDISWWHVVQRRLAPAGAHILNRECAVVFVRADASATHALPLRVAFGRKDSLRIHTFGLSTPGDGWVWTEGPSAALLLPTPPALGDVELTLDANAFITSLTPDGQRLHLRVNGELIATRAFGAARESARFRVPEAVWNARAPRTIVLEMPDAVSPARAGRSGDQRQLGLQIFELNVAPAAP